MLSLGCQCQGRCKGASAAYPYVRLQEMIDKSTKIVIRKAVRGTIYRTALRDFQRNCIGFILGGDAPPWIASFDFSLNVSDERSTDSAAFLKDLALLETYFPYALQTATIHKKTVLAIYCAWDTDEEDHKLKLGAVMELARSLSLPYVLEAPTTAFETLWAFVIYDTRVLSRRIENNVLREPSVEMLDNPRRVQATWRTITKEGRTRRCS